MDFSEYWNNNYKYKKPSYDGWLDKYSDIIMETKTKVLDLGAGCGSDSEYLAKCDKKIVACDFSSTALEKINKLLPQVETILLDISKPLSFESNSFDLIIADLSLHYFDEITTFEIMHEIKRILTVNGTLLARVNSVKDTNYGAGNGKKIEENYYFSQGYNKRFFNENDVEKYFSVIGEVNYFEGETSRFGNTKHYFEIKVTKS